MAHNPELDYEFNENAPKEKPVHIYPSEIIQPNAGNTYRAVETQQLGHLVQMKDKKGTVSMLKYGILAVVALAAVLGTLYLLWSTGVLANL